MAPTTGSRDQVPSPSTQKPGVNPQPDEGQEPDPPQNPQSDPQSPKSLAVEDLDLEKLHDQQDADDANQDDPDDVTPFSPSTTANAITAVYRRGGCGGGCGGAKRKRNNQKRRAAQEKKSLMKLEILTETLEPIPFVPIKNLDFSRHEEVLKRLGLWEFVHLEFDRSIRGDLIAQLIANFSPGQRASYVNGVRIMVNRADLGRALKLPVKQQLRKDREGVAVEVVETEEDIGFIEELVSNWVLLHDDTWMMPAELVNWMKVIKEGHFDKIDWAGMIWFMVEKELIAAPPLGNCYYASHMQLLIKHQREELLKEEPKEEVDAKEKIEVKEEDVDGKEEIEVKEEEVDVKEEIEVKEEEEVDVKEEIEVKEEEEEEEEEEEDGGGDVKMRAVDDIRGEVGLQEHSIELCLGQDNGAKSNLEKERIGHENSMDFEETKVEERSGQWLLDGKNNECANDHFLRPCNLGVLDSEDENKEEEEVEDERQEGEDEEEEHGAGFQLSAKDDTIEGLGSVNLIDAMEAAQIPFCSELQIRDDSTSGEFLASRVDTQTIPGSSSLFGHGNKRDIGPDGDLLNVNNSKRLKTHGPLDMKSSDFDTCMEQAQHWMGKARAIYLAKEQDVTDFNMHHQVLMNELQQRDNMIEQLHRAKVEEQERRQLEIYKLERELFMMGNLLDGYRKALKETHKAFTEYRARSPLPDEPLYKDAGPGGLVLSTLELEEQRKKQEEEARANQLSIEKKIKEFEASWLSKFGAHEERVQLLDNRLLDVGKEFKCLKELHPKCKATEVSECALTEQ